MALKTTKKETKKATPKQSSSKPVVRQSVTAAPVGKKTEAQKKEEALKPFLPENIKYLKDIFGIDLNSRDISAKTVADIASGRVTDPLEMVVRPLAYDKSLKENVEMPPVKVVASVKIVFPYEKGTFKQLPLDEDHKMFFASYPCFDTLVKSEVPDLETAEERESNVSAKDLKFSKEQVLALEGLGIRENRLYAGAYNALSADEKSSILNGLPFDVTGTLRISDGFSGFKDVSLNGVAQLKTNSKGEVTTRFEPQYPIEATPGRVIDLLKVRRIDKLELDFFERTPSGKIKTDVGGAYVINKAGRELATYGVSFTPVDGYTHTPVWDDKEKRYVDPIEKSKYQVSVLNGGLCVTKMEKVNELDKDGNQIMTKVGGKEVPKYHYEVKDARVKDGKVYVNGELLEPASPKDLENYKRGIGGLFKNAKWVEYGEGGKKKEVTYDAYAVPNNQKSGFAKVFSPSTSAKLTEELAIKQKAGKKQNYSVGIH